MAFPDWINAFSPVDVWQGLNTNVLSDQSGQVAFFRAEQEIIVPEHSHAGQWGVVIEGTLELTIAGIAKVLTAGEHYNIPSGAPHSAKISAGTVFLEVFEGHRFHIDI